MKLYVCIFIVICLSIVTVFFCCKRTLVKETPQKVQKSKNLIVKKEGSFYTVKSKKFRTRKSGNVSGVIYIGEPTEGLLNK
ncbi:hypothetical protein IJG72_01060 [bacterium]|nr:hypothetical protein [bacterium]